MNALIELLRDKRLAVLTGAGCSTESGIPDYRGPETRRRARNSIQYKAFMADALARRRYWARAVVGWRRFADTRPNPGHHALALLEARGALAGLITQNVDRLHHAAGSRAVVELHGALAEVRCMSCSEVCSREDFQAELMRKNPGFEARAAEMAPDGDAELDAASIEGFDVPACPRCGGFYKPNVVFFGESVPAPTVERAYGMVEDADALLVVGTSCAVFSGYRFVRRAAARELPIAIVNLSESRADPYAGVLVRGRSGEVLPRLVDALGRTGASASLADG